MQMESPQASLPISQRGSSVLRRGCTFLSLVSLSQFFTAHFQSHVCFSRSKARPGGHLMACRPCQGCIRTGLQNVVAYPGCALDDISAGIVTGLQTKQFAGALSSAELLLLSQLLIALTENSWNVKLKSFSDQDRSNQLWRAADRLLDRDKISTTIRVIARVDEINMPQGLATPNVEWLVAPMGATNFPPSGHLGPDGRLVGGPREKSTCATQPSRKAALSPHYRRAANLGSRPLWTRSMDGAYTSSRNLGGSRR